MLNNNHPRSVLALLLNCLTTMSHYSEDLFASEESVMVSVDILQEQDAPPTKKKKISEEELINVVGEEAEENRNTLSQEWEDEEMGMPPPQKHPGKLPVEDSGSLGANPRKPLTSHPTPKQLGRRFTTTSKRKTSGEDSSSSAEESEAASQVIVRPRGIILTVRQERDVVEWFQGHEIFYNKKLRDYKDTGKKTHLLEEKAAELNVHVNQLKKWYDGMRTRFARISATRTGQGPVLDELTERDRWIYHSFQFLRPHIVRVPSRQSKTFRREKQASRPSTSSIPDVQVVDYDDLSVPTSTPSALRSPSSDATPDKPQNQLLEKLSQQYHQTMALQNRLVSTFQPQSTHVKQVTHFMAFLGSLCETMTPVAWKSFMVKAQQLALEHMTTHSAEPPPKVFINEDDHCFVKEEQREYDNYKSDTESEEILENQNGTAKEDETDPLSICKTEIYIKYEVIDNDEG